MNEQLIPEQQRVTDVVASLAVTLDGFMCRRDWAVDYLERYPLDGFDRPTLILTSATDLPVPDGAEVTFRAIVPEAIGEGLPWFTKPFSGPLRPLTSTQFDNGAVRLVYDTNPEGLSK